MEKERKIFNGGGDGVEGAVKRGRLRERCAPNLDQMMDFAQYAFNKSHACASCSSVACDGIPEGLL